jgi:hypothetical protein
MAVRARLFDGEVEQVERALDVDLMRRLGNELGPRREGRRPHGRSQHKRCLARPRRRGARRVGPSLDIMKRDFSRVAPPRMKQDGTRARDA